MYCQINPEAKRANHWYFGNGAGIDFSSGTAIADVTGNLNSWEGSASISDTNGDLLFYTNGDTVWDRTHNIMVNGLGLFGCISSVQGVIIIPKPFSNTVFYIFTVDCAENLGIKGMNYSIVDLSLNSGLGVVTLKNQFLFSPSAESMAATTNCSMDSVWLVGHEYGNNKFYAYLITKEGLNATPITSSIGTPVTIYESQMKFSPNSKKIICYLDLLDFNFSNGTIYNSIQLPLTGYGSSFSSDSKKLYISSSGNLIIQLDATKTNSIDLATSYNIIYNGLDNSEYYGLQLANDSKIYVAKADSSKISKIDFPNNNGISVNFNPYSIDLNNKICQGTFPSFIESYFNNDNTTICYQKEDIIIPNVFTPNNDGVNDLFTITITGYSSVNYSIYNRWGNELLSKSNQIIANKTVTIWDGKIKEDNASDGVYYYVIHLTNYKNENLTKKGFIQLFN